MRKPVLLALVLSSVLSLFVALLSNLAAASLAPALAGYPWVVYAALIVTFVIALPLSGYLFSQGLGHKEARPEHSPHDRASESRKEPRSLETLRDRPYAEGTGKILPAGVPPPTIDPGATGGIGAGDFRYDVFLSYNSAQKEWTRDLARRLRDSGLSVWFDEWRLRGGENWMVGLRRGVNESRHVVFVVSPESIDAVWPLFEVYLTIFHDPIAQDRKLIPIIHSPCDLPDELAIRQYIDFSDTHDRPQLYEFRLAQLMADLDPAGERPTDFDLYVDQMEDEELDTIPPVGPLPRGSVMPLRPNPHFVGREDELRELERLLRAGSTTAIGQVAAATGLGGIGKTQLAVEYVHRYGRRYPGGVYWLDMEDPTAIPSEVARCGGPEGMDLPGFGALSLDEQVARVKKEWGKATLRLLIFDNVSDADVVGEWRPVTGGCRVAVTSLRSVWPSALGLREVRLDTLPRDKAIELLCKGKPEALEDDGEREAADAICETMGDLPLAVALAGCYLEFYKHDVTLAQYLEELQDQPVLENLALVDFVQDPSPTDHIQNVAATFEMSYRRLEANDDTDLLAMKLLHLASHFAPVSISREFLMRAAGLDPDVERDRRRATDALRRLTALGLTEEEAEGRLLLHRLLGEFAMQHPAPGQTEEQGWEAVAHTLLQFAHREDESGLPAVLARELPHLRRVAAEAVERNWERAGELSNSLGYHLDVVAAYGEAREHYERALVIDEAAYGPDHPAVGRDVNNLGSVLKAMGDLEGAREHYERALAICRRAYGEDHPRTQAVLANLRSLERG